MPHKKNRVSVFGKTFHMTPAGKMYPLGAKNNYFTRCMSDALKGNLITGKDLTPAQIQSNKDKFGAAVPGCKALKTGRKRGRPAKA
nr:MAG: hypothetical protein [uncultured archaeon]